MEEYKVTTVTLDNGEDYIVLKDLTIGGKRYCYFVNVVDENDFCIRRVEEEQGKAYFCYLEDDVEFKKVMDAYVKANEQ